MPDRMQEWLEAHDASIVLVLLMAAVALRTILVLASPTPFGYVWDFYHDGVRILATEYRLPVAADCWQCYHPPLFYALGAPLWALGALFDRAGEETWAMRFTAALSLPASFVVIHYGWRLIGLFRVRGASRQLGLALLTVCPVLFISSWGAEADIVVTALLSAFIFHFVRYTGRARRATIAQVAWIGILAGLAAATKYSGLVALATAGVWLGWRTLTGPARARAIRDGLIILSVCCVVGGWKYADNVARHATPFFANGSASDGLSFGDRRATTGHYEWTTLRLSEVATLFEGREVRGDLTAIPVYRSVPTTLHALVWSDMSFFSVRTRHGSPGDPYPFKDTPVPLVMTVIVLGFVPEILALVGVAVTVRRRLFQPLLIFGGVTLGAYLWWVLPQEAWALKSKYILCLLPPGVVFVVAGHNWLLRQVPWLGMMAGLLLAALVVVAHAYLLVFALG